MGKFPIATVQDPKDDGFDRMPSCFECEDTGEKPVWENGVFFGYEPCDFCQPEDDGFGGPYLHEMWCSAVQYGEECNCQPEEGE